MGSNRKIIAEELPENQSAMRRPRKIITTCEIGIDFILLIFKTRFKVNFDLGFMDPFK
jgi:hypothetical protein